MATPPPIPGNNPLPPIPPTPPTPPTGSTPPIPPAPPTPPTPPVPPVPPVMPPVIEEVEEEATEISLPSGKEEEATRLDIPKFKEQAEEEATEISLPSDKEDEATEFGIPGTTPDKDEATEFGIPDISKETDEATELSGPEVASAGLELPPLDDLPNLNPTEPLEAPFTGPQSQMPEIEKPFNPEDKEKKPKGKSWILWLVIGVTVAAIVGFVLWYFLSYTNNSNGPRTRPIDSEPIDTVVVEQEIEMVENEQMTDSQGNLFSYTGPINEFGQAEGEGTGQYNNGTYQGHYVNGRRQGEGTYTLSDGSNTFVGTFENDAYSEGKLSLNTDRGEYFVGTFRDGQPWNGSWYDQDGEYMLIVEGRQQAR